MQTADFDGISYFLPEKIEEVKELLYRAKQEKKVLAVRGASHSIPLMRKMDEEPMCIAVMLSRLNKITYIDWEKRVVTVQAGCHLGYDPFDPTKVSTLENSLVFQLDPAGLNGRRTTPPGMALPHLGGISHQTIGGFTATASAGGSATYSLETAIMSVRVIYHGESGVEDKIFERPESAEDDPDNPFWGVAFAHLGLMGVVVEMTLKCEQGFNIRGSEIISRTTNCSIDLFGQKGGGKPGLQQYLEEAPYARMVWWAQESINKVFLWSAKREDAFKDWPIYRADPYRQVPYIVGSPTIATFLFYVVFSFIGRVCLRVERWVLKTFGPTPEMQKKITQWFFKLKAWLIEIILTGEGKQEFHDTWLHGLPMDNQMSDRLAPAWFTELSIPLDHTEEVMISLREFFKDPVNAGTFCVELYASKKSAFWLSPAYGTNTIRVDVYWFAKNLANPVEYFERFWKLLKRFNFRYHWGKFMDDPKGEQGVRYLKKNFPKWDSYMELRKKMDPYNLLLTKYWKDHLDI